MWALLQVVFFSSLLVSLQAKFYSKSVTLRTFQLQLTKSYLALRQAKFKGETTFIGDCIELTTTNSLQFDLLDYLSGKLFYMSDYYVNQHLFTFGGSTLEIISKKLYDYIIKMTKGYDVHLHVSPFGYLEWKIKESQYEQNSNMCHKNQVIVFHWNDDATIADQIKPKIMSELFKARVYREVNSNLPQEYWDYDSYIPEWGNQSDFKFGEVLGSGKYSEVYKCTEIKTNKTFVIKVLKPIDKWKISREIKILKSLAGGLNIISLWSTVKDPVSRSPALVLEYIEAMDFKQWSKKFSDYDLRYYIFELLKALDYSHSMGIMHRDIKPHNIGIDYAAKKLRLLDWGLAEFYHPEQTYNVRVATRHYKGPELLLNYRLYDYSLDMWSLGCVFAGIIFQKIPFFNGSDNYEQLIVYAKYLGSDDLFSYINKYKLQSSPKFNNTLHGHVKKSWSTLVNSANKHLANSQALEFLDGLLQYDHQKRLTAREAMAHPYLSQIIAKHGGLPPVINATVVVANQMTLMPMIKNINSESADSASNMV